MNYVCCLRQADRKAFLRPAQLCVFLPTEALPAGAWPCGKLRDQILQANPKVPVQQAFHCCLAMAGAAVGAQTSSFLT